MDPMVYEYDCSGKPLVNLPEESLSKKALKNILTKIQL